MFRLAIATLLTAMPALPTPATAETAILAVVAPKEGPLSILGQQVFEGARFAAAAQGGTIVEIAENCDAAAEAGIATAVIAAQADAAIGFLCTESLQQALPGLADAGIPALTLSVRSGVLMEDALKHGWPLFRLAPGPQAEAEKTAEIIIRDWRAEPFALIDDGTIHARELAEAVRLRLEEVGMRPAFVDTFRPAQEQQVSLVRRLARTGATRVFIGGDRADTAIIARDAAAEGYRPVLLGSETLIAADQSVAMADGVQAVALPPFESLPGNAALVAAMRESGIFAEGYVLPAHAAAAAAQQAKALAAREETSIVEALSTGPFTTAIGTVGFTAGRELRGNPYRLLEWRDGVFAPLDISGEAP